MRTPEKGKFPTQPQPNPTSQCHVSSSSKNQVEDVNSITTLWSGKIIDKIIPPKDQKPDSLPTLEGNNDGKDKGEFVNNEHLEKEKSHLPVPFSQRLPPTQNVNKNSEIFGFFKQVKINIPLLDAIK